MAALTYSYKGGPLAGKATSPPSPLSTLEPPRQWVSRAGWMPGHAAPLVAGGELDDGVVRAGRAWLARQRRVASSRLEYAAGILAVCDSLRALFSEEGGIDGAMGTLRHALADDGGNDTDALREHAVEAFLALIGRINHIHGRLARALRDADADATESSRIVNLHLDTLVGWNQAVAAHGKAHRDSDPLDALAHCLAAREAALDELYRHIDIDVEEKRSASLIVSMHGANLVYFGRRAVYTPGHAHLAPLRGRLAAHIEARDRLVPRCTTILGEWTASFAAAFNQAYRNPRGMTGESAPPGHDIFHMDAAAFPLALHPALVDTPGTLSLPAGRRAMASAATRAGPIGLERVLTETRAAVLDERDRAAQVAERTAGHERMMAGGCGEEAMAGLLNSQRMLMSLVQRSDQVERFYGKLAGSGG